MVKVALHPTWVALSDNLGLASVRMTFLPAQGLVLENPAQNAPSIMGP